MRFLLTGGAPSFGTSFGASLATNTANQIAAWARAHCAPVPATSVYPSCPAGGQDAELVTAGTIR